MGIRIVSPINTIILSFFRDGIMKTTATLSMWLIYISVLWLFTWIVFMQPKNEETKQTR